MVVDHFIADGSLAKSDEICEKGDSVTGDGVTCSMNVLRYFNVIKTVVQLILNFIRIKTELISTNDFSEIFKAGYCDYKYMTQ